MLRVPRTKDGFMLLAASNAEGLTEAWALDGGVWDAACSQQRGTRKETGGGRLADSSSRHKGVPRNGHVPRRNVT